MNEKRSGSQPGELFWEEEVWILGNRLRLFGGGKIHCFGWKHLWWLISFNSIRERLTFFCFRRCKSYKSGIWWTRLIQRNINFWWSLLFLGNAASQSFHSFNPKSFYSHSVKPERGSKESYSKEGRWTLSQTVLANWGRK